MACHEIAMHEYGMFIFYAPVQSVSSYVNRLFLRKELPDRKHGNIYKEGSWKTIKVM
jgi:UDP-galactopyranose mutase